jgi:hypothetical protein
MAKVKISSEEIWKRVEENRLAEERAQEPYLIAFRATQEEIEMRKAEDAKEAARDASNFSRWGERIARAGRESVRFDRHLIRQGFYPRIPKDDQLGIERGYPLSS